MSLPKCIRDSSREARQSSDGGEPLRVCFVIDELGVAGIEGQLLLLLNRLDRSRVKPYLCLLRGDDTYREVLRRDHVSVIQLGVGSLLRPAIFLRARDFARFLREERIDVLHALFHDSLYFGAPVAKLAGVPCIVRFRVDLGYWMKWKDRWLLRILSRIVDATMANCEACRQVSIHEEWAAPSSVAIIPNGVDLSRFNGSPARAARSETDLEQHVGVVANLRPVKNLELFIRAAGRLESSHPNVRFEIAGEGSLRSELQGLIDELGLRERVKLLGTVADIPAFLASLDVAVLCSHSEGSPNAIMEYMAAGLPSVVTDVGGNRELIEHERHGLVVPPNDLDQLTLAVGRLLDDRALASHMGAAARQRAFAEFSVETQARRYEDFYHELVLRKLHRI